MLKIKAIKPMYTAIVTTMDTYQEAQFMAGSQLLDVTKTVGGLREYQKVLAVGSAVREVKVGDLVCKIRRAHV